MAELGEGQKTIAKGAFWNFWGSVAVKLLSFVYTILLARLFSQESIGLFYLALSVIYLVAVFGDLGLNSAVGRYLPFYIGKGEKRKAYVLLNASYLFSGILSTIMAGVIFFTAGLVANSFGMPALAPTLQLLSWFLVVNTFFALNTAFLTGLKKMKELAAINGFQNIMKIVLTLILYFALGPQAFVISLAFSLSFLFLIAASFWYLKKEVATQKIEGEKATLDEEVEMLKETVPFGITLAIIGQIASIAFYMNWIMMGYLLSPEVSVVQIGIYSIASALALIIGIFPGSVISIFLPHIAELYGKGDRKGMENVSGTAVRWNALLSVPITIIMVLFAAEMLQMFYGSAYIPGAFVLMALSTGFFIRQLSSVQGTILASMRIVKVELYAAVVSLFLNFALGWLLIPTYGMNGAAAAFLVSLAAVSILIVYYCKKLVGWHFLRETAKPVFAGLIAFAVIFALRGELVYLMGQIPPLPIIDEGIAAVVLQKIVKLAILGVIFLVACAVYLLAVALLRALEKEDVKVLAGALRRAKVPKEWIERIEGIAGKFTA